VAKSCGAESAGKLVMIGEECWANLVINGWLSLVDADGLRELADRMDELSTFGNREMCNENAND
jgi:hypothetical protein